MQLRADVIANQSFSLPKTLECSVSTASVPLHGGVEEVCVVLTAQSSCTSVRSPERTAQIIPAQPIILSLPVPHGQHLSDVASHYIAPVVHPLSSYRPLFFTASELRIGASFAPRS